VGTPGSGRPGKLARSRGRRARTLAVLIVDSRARRRHHELSGSSDLDGSLIVSRIKDAALCADCIARKTGIPRGRVEDAITDVARTLDITTDAWRWDGCLKQRVVQRLD
jgi:hypothetical protein